MTDPQPISTLTHRFDLRELATPFIIFDPEIMRANIRQVRKQLPEAELFYSTKANSLPFVLKTMRDEGVGFEINTVRELERLNAAGDIQAKDIINSSVVTSSQDLRAHAGFGVNQFCIDRSSQVENLAINAPGAAVLVRIRVPEKGSQFSFNARFGIDVSVAGELVKLAEKKGLEVRGVHFHVGSQCSNPDNWRTGMWLAAELMEAHPQMDTLNLGGGLPAIRPESRSQAEEILAVIGRTHEEIIKAGNRRLQLELGRFLVANSALLGSRVIQLQEREKDTLATLDASVFSGLFELFESGHDIEYPMSCSSQKPARAYRLEGPTCAGIDLLAPRVMLPELSVDHRGDESDLVYFENTGAYSMAYVSGNDVGFNGSRIPTVYVVEHGELIRYG